MIDEELYNKEFVDANINNFELLKNKFKRIPTTKMLKRTGLTKEQFDDFFKLFIESENIISAWTKGNLFFVENKLLSEKTNLEYPFILLTGRTRDQWHTGTKTNLPATLLTKAFVTDRILEKTIFIPISNREINYLTNDLCDKESREPDYNHSAVKVEKV